MKSIHHFELPPNLRKVLKKTKKLEWITLIYLLSVAVIMYLSLGSSQAMKTAWLEDVLSLIPSLAFLITTKVNDRSANENYPYGYHRVFSISFLAGAVAVFGMGVFLIYDSGLALINSHHPTIGFRTVFGYRIWMGWIMIVALLYSAVPAMILGAKKLPLAVKLHNKVLYTDASAQKADYMTALAAIVGIILVGFGLWWADAVAALFISVSVVKDGVMHLREAATDLMDRYPQKIKENQPDEVIREVETTAGQWSWVKDVAVRFRESGQVYFGEIAVVPQKGYTMEDLEEGYKEIRNINWRLFDFTIAPVQELPPWGKKK